MGYLSGLINFKNSTTDVQYPGENLIFTKKIIGATSSILWRKNPHYEKILIFLINFRTFNEAENIPPLCSACTAEPKNFKCLSLT